MQSHFPSQPWSTYSSVPLILIAFIFMKRNHGQAQLILLCWIYIFAAIGSIALHGTFTILGQMLDFAGIALVMLWQILWYRNLKTKKFLLYFIILAFGLFAFLFLGEWTRFPAVITSALFLIKDLYIFEYKNRHPQQFLLKQAFLATTFGVVLFVIDNQRWWCGSHELMHGHFWWHLIVCFSLYRLILYYSLKADAQGQNTE